MKSISMLRALVLVGGLLLAREASASVSGYICQVAYDPNTSGSTGNYGYVYVTVYSSPGCTGTYQGGGYFCSSGATSASCALTNLYSEIALQHLVDRLQDALARGLRTIISTDASNRLRYLNVYAD